VTDTARRTVRRAASAAAAAAVATAAWHIVPAGTWLPRVRATLSPALDGRGRPGHIALTFDDGPDPRSTPRFLRELERLSVRATFFLLGSELERYPQLGRRIVEEGHELAVHGWRHDRPWYPRPWSDVRELERAVESVGSVSGRRPRFYRPPYGILTATRWSAARQLGLQPVLWTAWGRDWTAWADRESVLREVARRFTGGATVLLHDSDRTSAPGSWHATLAALPLLVAMCRAERLAIGPLAEHGLGYGHFAGEEGQLP
jgi:peptidoglycan/xylan/chitin deacetylase (PgdA/CDA1 family)